METLKKQPQIKALRVRNFRALRDVEINNITPLTVLLGSNGSGKSTVFDVFKFLTDCMAFFSVGRALALRGGFRELRSRGSDGPISIELEYIEPGDGKNPSAMIYKLEIDEADGRAQVQHESLRSEDGEILLNFKQGQGDARSEPPQKGQERTHNFSDTDMLAASVLGLFSEYPRIQALRDFVFDWRIFDLSAKDMRGFPDGGAQKELSKSGDNLANVIRHLEETHPSVMEDVAAAMRRMVPAFGNVMTDTLKGDGRLLLTLKDAPFDKPILAKYASGGTLKLLACLVLLKNPERPPLILLEEPENFLYPRLLHDLAEQCAIASPGSQVMAATHSPYFLDPLDAEHVQVLSRREDGFTVIRRASDIKGIKEFIKEGLSLDELWMANYFSEPEKTGA